MIPEQSHHNPEPQSLRSPLPIEAVKDFHKAVGITDFDLKKARVLIESGGDYRQAKLPMKIVLYAHYQIFLDAIWSKVAAWNQQFSQSGGLINTAQLGCLSDPAFLQNPGPLRELKNFLPMIRPLGVSEVSALKLKFGAAGLESGVRELAASMGKTFQAFSYQFELEQHAGIHRTMSLDGKIDLYAQCRELLIQERAGGFIRKCRMPPVKAWDEARSSLGCAPVTLILSGGAGAGAEIMFLIPPEHRVVLAAQAQVHQAYVHPLVNLFITLLSSEGSTPRASGAILSDALKELRMPRCPYAKMVAKNFAEAPINSSMEKVAAGCPAFGSPVFPGFLAWSKTLRELYL